MLVDEDIELDNDCLVELNTGTRIGSKEADVDDEFEIEFVSNLIFGVFVNDDIFKYISYILMS